MLVIYSLYFVFLVYGLILFVTGFNTLPKEVKQSLNSNEVEMFDAEMTQRQIIGLLLLAVPVFSFVWWLILYF
jgi:hypothetical protein